MEQPKLSLASPLASASPSQTLGAAPAQSRPSDVPAAEAAPDSAAAPCSPHLQPSAPAAVSPLQPAAPVPPSASKWRTAAAIQDSSDDDDAPPTTATAPVRRAQSTVLADSSDEEQDASALARPPRRRLKSKAAAVLDDSSDDDDDDNVSGRGSRLGRRVAQAASAVNAADSASDGASNAGYQDFDHLGSDGEEDSMGSFIVDDDDDDDDDDDCGGGGSADESLSLGEEDSGTDSESESDGNKKGGAVSRGAGRLPKKDKEHRNGMRQAGFSPASPASPPVTPEPPRTPAPKMTPKVAGTPAQRRRAFVARRDALVARYLKEFNSSVFDARLPADLQVEWSTRLNTTAGRAILKRKGSVRTAHIELSTKVRRRAQGWGRERAATVYVEKEGNSSSSETRRTWQ